jgi:hypothetical protein
LRGLYAERPAQQVFDIFLDSTMAEKARRDDAGFIGSLNFFGMPATREDSTRAVSFEVADAIMRLARAGRLDVAMRVSFVPKTDARGKAGFARIELDVR